MHTRAACVKSLMHKDVTEDVTFSSVWCQIALFCSPGVCETTAHTQHKHTRSAAGTDVVILRCVQTESCLAECVRAVCVMIFYTEVQSLVTRFSAGRVHKVEKHRSLFLWPP